MSLAQPSLFTEIAKFMATEQVEELETQGKLLLPKASLIEQKTQAIIAELEMENKRVIERLSKARNLVIEELITSSSPDRDKFADELLIAIDTLSRQIPEEEFEQAGSLQKLLGFSDENITWMYELASRFYEQKKHEESLCLFSFLTVLNPFLWQYWVGLGLAQKELNLDDNALFSFFAANSLAPENPQPCYQTALTLIKQSKFTEALAELEILQKLISAQHLDALKPHVDELLQQVKNK